MNQLRRRFASLWKREEGGDDAGARQQPSDAGNNGQNPSRRTSSGSSGSSTSSAGVPAALEIDAAGSTSPHRESQGQQHGQQCIDGCSSKEEDGAEEEPSPPRLLSLSHPWGTSDPRPPPGWTSSCSSQRPLRSTNHRLRYRVEEAAAADGHLSSLVDPGVPAARSHQQSSPANAASAAGGVRVGRRRRGREEDEEEGEEGEEACSYRNGPSYRGNAAAAKRHRASEDQGVKARLLSNGGGGGGGGGGERGDEEEDSNQQQQQQPTSRRWRTCPADSAFVSPAAKRSVSYCSSTVGAATAVALEADQDHEELEHRRSSTPSRLIFRAGFFKALRGSRAAAKRARSATKLKRKTRELQAAIVRQAFHSAHPQRGDGGEREEQKEEGVPRRGAGGVRGTRALSAREIDNPELWRRVNLAEEERDHAADQKALARLRRLDKLRDEALEAFAQAQEAHSELLAAANTAFNAAEGPDMGTLRSLFAGGQNNPSSRFKDDREVSALQKRYADLEAFLQQLKAAESAGDAGALEALLASEPARSATSQPEVASASKALQAAKARSDEEAEAARAAAAAAAAATAAAEAAKAAKAQREKEEAAAAAVAQAEAAKQAQAAAARAAAEDKFVKRADELKAAVLGHRAAIDQVLTSTDPGVKKIRMSFKKSYQGSLNKLSAMPSTVRQVVSEIQQKAEAPLADARRAGWESEAKEFLYFNLAEKLVGYSERDHFSGDTYRMAFPLACVAVDLMKEHEGLADLFLGTLYTRCPSAVPDLSFDTAGLSDGEMMARLGQLPDEDISTFLGRTKGLVVLMATAMQTPPHGGTTTKHPLPLAQGWRWLARFVNGLKGYVKKGHPPPVPTGPVLEWFLKVAGFEMQRRYGRAFDKVVQTIKTEILPILLPKKMVPHLLDVVLEDYEGRGRRFVPPAGRDMEFRQFRGWGDT